MGISKLGNLKGLKVMNDIVENMNLSIISSPLLGSLRLVNTANSEDHVQKTVLLLFSIYLGAEHKLGKPKFSDSFVSVTKQNLRSRMLF